MNRNLKGRQWESGDNNSGKDGIGDGEDDFNELDQELNKEEGLGEPVQQTLANILGTVWQNPQSYEKIKDQMKIYARPENCSSLVVKKCNKEIRQAHLTSEIGQKTYAVKKFKQLCQKASFPLLRQRLKYGRSTVIDRRNSICDCRKASVTTTANFYT